MRIAPKERGDDDIPKPSDTAFVAEMKDTAGKEASCSVCLGSGSGFGEVNGEEKASEVEKDGSESSENPAPIGSPVSGSAAPEKPAEPVDTTTLGPTDRSEAPPNSVAEQPSKDISGNVVSTSALNPEKHVSSQAMTLVGRPVLITEGHTQGVGFTESFVRTTEGQAEGVPLTTMDKPALALIEASVLVNETTPLLRDCNAEGVKRVIRSGVDKVAGLLASSVVQAHSASTLLSDGHPEITSEADPASVRANTRSPNVTSKSLLSARDDVLDTATLARTPTDENTLPVDTSTIPSSLPPSEHVEIERACSPVAAGTTSEAPSSPLTELSSELDITGRTTGPSTRYRAGRNANAKDHKEKGFPASRLHGRASSDESDSDASDGSGFSIDATSSDFSSPPPRLPSDCVVPSPFFIPKELRRPMEVKHLGIISNSENEPQVKMDPSPELMLIEDSLWPHAIKHAEPSSDLLCPRPFEDAIASDRLDCGDDGRDTQHGVTSNLRSGHRARKRKRRRSRSRSRSPLHSYNEEEALALFGHNLTLYSVCGPPGGFPIGIGTLQCHPVDDGRSSFNFCIEYEMQRLLAESMQTTVKKGSEASGSGAVPSLSRLSKPHTSKRRGTKKKIESKARDVNNEDLANYSTCHACSRKTNYPKMKCSALRKSGTQCKLHFCNRCIERRFPDIQFDTQNLSFICPRCAGTCFCMMCKISQSKLPAELAKDKDDEENVMRADTLTSSSTIENPPFNLRQPSLRKTLLKVSTSTTVKDKMNESPVSKKVEQVMPTGKVADPNSGVGPSSSTGRSSLSSGTLTKRPTTMRLATLKRKAVDDGMEEEALMPETFRGEVDTSTNSAIVGKDSRVVAAAKPVAKRARGPQIANLLRDRAPASDRKLCHQCRTRSTYAKMHCSAVTDYGEICQMTYCHRCIVTRYSDVEFIADGSFTCFRCSNQCNCDVCTRRRGEEFVTSANFQKTTTEHHGTSVVIPKSTLLTEQTQLENAAEHAQCGSNVPTDDEEAEEWIRSHRAGLSTAGKNSNNREEQYRAFIGDWQPSWGPMRSCVEMDGALLPTEAANGGSPISPRPHLYIGRLTTFQRSASPLNGTDETNNPLKSLPQSQKPQAKSLPNVRSRSGRIVKPSEKIRQHESDHEDELSFSSARKKRSEAISSVAHDTHDSASPSLSSVTKTTTTERSPAVMPGLPLSDCATVDHANADVSAGYFGPSGADPLALQALSPESQLPTS